MSKITAHALPMLLWLMLVAKAQPQDMTITPEFQEQIRKWKKAVIHLECRGDTLMLEERVKSSRDHFKRLEELSRQLQTNAITREEFAARMVELYKERQAIEERLENIERGAAIFLKHNGVRYLITARHVVHDHIKAEHKVNKARHRYGPNGSEPSEWQLRYELQGADAETYWRILRVPSLDEFETARKSGKVGATFSAGAVGAEMMVMRKDSVQAGRPLVSSHWRFAPAPLDLALTCLDDDVPSHRKFADELESHGYSAVTIQDIGLEPSSEGVPLFAIGFPSPSELGPPPDFSAWIPALEWSLPTLSFGRVSNLHSNLSFFVADISIYPGNSGGPVIENGKLVGIVLANFIIPSERMRIPFGQTLKGSHVKDLVLRVDKENEKKTKAEP